MRWVLITPFGMPVEPEVKRIFAIVSGAIARERARPTRARRRCASSSAAIGGGDVAPTAASAGANVAGSAPNTRPGASSAKIARSLAKSFDISE